MDDQYRDVVVVITRRVRVRVPLSDPEAFTERDTIRDFCEEIAQGGQDVWPEFITNQDEEFRVRSVKRCAS